MSFAFLEAGLEAEAFGDVCDQTQHERAIGNLTGGKVCLNREDLSVLASLVAVQDKTFIGFHLTPRLLGGWEVEILLDIANIHAEQFFARVAEDFTGTR